MKILHAKELKRLLSLQRFKLGKYFFLTMFVTCYQKLTDLGYKSLPHLPYSHDLSPTGSHFLKLLDIYSRPKIPFQKRSRNCI